MSVFGSVGALTMLGNEFSATSIASATASFMLGAVIGETDVQTKKDIEEKKRNEVYTNIAVGAVSATVFTAGVSHLLVNKLSLRTATLVQLGIGIVTPPLANQRIFPHNPFRDNLSVSAACRGWTDGRPRICAGADSR